MRRLRILLKGTGIIMTLVALLTACGTENQPSHPELPLSIKYTVESTDTAALAMVNTYYADQLNYTIYDSTTLYMRREGLMSAGEKWFDGEHLFIRETEGPYCTCVKLEGQLLQFWLDDDWLGEVSATGRTGQQLGLETELFAAVDQMDDTTLIELTRDIPNGWIDKLDLPGMPLRYSYKVRGADVHYTAEAIGQPEATFSPEAYDQKCVHLPAEAYMGFAPNDSVSWSANSIWVYGNLLDGRDQPITGEVAVESGIAGANEAPKAKVEQGLFDIELQAGELYTLDFTAPGYVHQRLEVDCRKMPKDGSNLIMSLDIPLFPANDSTIADYLETTPVGVAAYDPDSATIVFDFAYTRAVQEELNRMMNGSASAP